MVYQKQKHEKFTTSISIVKVRRRKWREIFPRIWRSRRYKSNWLHQLMSFPFHGGDGALSIFLPLVPRSHLHKTDLFAVIIDLNLESFLSLLSWVYFPLLNVVFKCLAFLIVSPFPDFHLRVFVNSNHMVYSIIKSVWSNSTVATEIRVLLAWPGNQFNV